MKRIEDGDLSINLSLTSYDSLMLKGIAICAMLWHHLFITAEYGNVVFFIGDLGKVCVSIFLFVSAYGLFVQYNKLDISSTSVGVKAGFRFLIKRLVKFYFNYWAVFLVFVPIGVFVFGRTLELSYGYSVNVYKRLIYDILGIQGFSSYNITWWFNKLIIVLYLLYPLLFFLMKRLSWLTLLVSLVALRYGNHVSWLNVNIGLTVWLFPFTLGMFWAKKSKNFNLLISNLNKYIFLLLSFFLLVGLIWVRMHNIIPHWSGIRIDGFLTLSIVLCLIACIRTTKYLKVILAYLGKHSINIYMVHTFIFYYWFKEFIYSFQHSVIIFFLLLLSCLAISIMLEFIKERCGIYRLQNLIILKFNR